MKDLIKAATILDKIFYALSIAVTVSAVALVIGLGILAAGFLFDLPPHMIGTGYATATLDFVTFTVADAYIPDHRIIWCQVAMELFLTLVCLVPAHFSIKAIRSIFSPMKNGEPFHNTVSLNLKKLARYTCSLGIGLNLLKIISQILLIKAFDLNLLLLSERIPKVQFKFVFDLSFLFVAGILLLLSYIFQYGEQLQQLSDETI